jgi:membrane fusion protein
MHFPFRNSAPTAAHVAKVSHTILTGNDATGPITLKEPAYRVTVLPERPTSMPMGARCRFSQACC